MACFCSGIVSTVGSQATCGRCAPVPAAGCTSAGENFLITCMQYVCQYILCCDSPSCQVLPFITRLCSYFYSRCVFLCIFQSFPSSVISFSCYFFVFILLSVESECCLHMFLKYASWPVSLLLVSGYLNPKQKPAQLTSRHPQKDSMDSF